MKVFWSKTHYGVDYLEVQANQLIEVSQMLVPTPAQHIIWEITLTQTRVGAALVGIEQQL